MSKENGRFEEGNTIGKNTRFKKNNKAANKYQEKYAELLTSYFREPPLQYVYERTYYKDGTLKSEKPIILPPKFPTFELFAGSIGVTHHTLLNWCEAHPRFSAAYEFAKNMQLGIGKAGGIMKQYDGNFTKFVLSNDHGMTDKTEQKIESDNTVSVEIKVVD